MITLLGLLLLLLFNVEFDSPISVRQKARVRTVPFHADCRVIAPNNVKTTRDEETRDCRWKMKKEVKKKKRNETHFLAK